MPPTFHARPAGDVLSELGSDGARGLGREEAARRLAEHGPNTLAAGAQRTVWTMLGEQLRDVMLWVLLAAVGISLLAGEVTDAVVIIAIIVLNTGLGVAQEHKAERSLEALREMAAPRAHVLREGQPVDLPAAELVPGDLVLLEAGNAVPADLRLVQDADLRLNEAALTGESADVAKAAHVVLPADTPTADRRNMAFAGTTISRGRGAGVVVATGDRTEVGRIAVLLGEMREGKTPLQARLEGLGRALAVGVLGVCAVVFLAGWARGFPVLGLFLTSVSLAVAAIPEGLPAVVTIVLALGTAAMVRRNVVTRRLRAVETLGSTTVICSDKTGTLTEGQMTVRRWWSLAGEGTVTGAGYAPEGAVQPAAAPAGVIRRLAEIAALCNDARLEAAEDGWRPVGDPMEGALLAFAMKAGVDPAAAALEWPRRAEIAFDPERRRMTTVHASAAGALVLVKGAPDSLLPLCTAALAAEGPRPLATADREAVEAALERFAGGALRVLAFAYRDAPALPPPGAEGALETDLVLVGLVGLMDPPRPEALEAVRRSRAAGVRAVMITGDHAATAGAIARELEIAPPGEGVSVLTGAEVAAMSEGDLRQRGPAVHVYARVSPADKLRIVTAYQAAGHIVAMTGDGVNDGPALKQADVGVAMGRSGTDVARGAADLVLLDDNFASIVAAVEEGRRIFDNIRKFVFYLLSCNVSEVLTLLLAVLVGVPQPLLPVQLLWLNLVTDGLPALALGLEPAEADAMRRPPRDPREGILTRSTLRGILVYGAFMTFATLAAYAHGLYWFCLAPLGYTGGDALAVAVSPGFWQSAEARSIEEGLIVARTLAFGTLAFSQLAHAFNSRSARRSLFALGLRSNAPLLVAVALSAAAQFVVINTPLGNRIFDTVPVLGGHLAVGVALSLSPLVFGEVRKAVLRFGDRRATGATAAPSAG